MKYYCDINTVPDIKSLSHQLNSVPSVAVACIWHGFQFPRYGLIKTELRWQKLVVDEEKSVTDCINIGS